MNTTIQAVFCDGVFRPIQPVHLPDNTLVEFEPRIQAPAATPAMEKGLGRIYEILGERYASGYVDTAARHNEHQP